MRIAKLAVFLFSSAVAGAAPGQRTLVLPPVGAFAHYMDMNGSFKFNQMDFLLSISVANISAQRQTVTMTMRRGAHIGASFNMMFHPLGAGPSMNNGSDQSVTCDLGPFGSGTDTCMQTALAGCADTGCSFNWGSYLPGGSTPYNEGDLVLSNMIVVLTVAEARGAVLAQANMNTWNNNHAQLQTSGGLGNIGLNGGRPF